jgi:DNA-directed RNA polymerase subunit RPC12/RpoP
MGKEIPMNQGPTRENAGLNVNINPGDLEDVVCEKCGSQTFSQVFLFKKLSAVLSPNGKDTFVPMQTYKCTECGHINKEFLSKNRSV